MEDIQQVYSVSDNSFTDKKCLFCRLHIQKVLKAVILVLSSGANELAVQKAKAEITRLIKEELIRLVSDISRMQRGRFLNLCFRRSISANVDIFINIGDWDL